MPGSRAMSAGLFIQDPPEKFERLPRLFRVYAVERESGVNDHEIARLRAIQQSEGNGSSRAPEIHEGRVRLDRDDLTGYGYTHVSSGLGELSSGSHDRRGRDTGPPSARAASG